MKRTLAIVLVAAACGGDDGDGMGGGGTEFFLSGPACETQVNYTGGGDERAVVILDTTGALDGVVVLDGELFSWESEAMWQTYAATSDTFLLLGFVDPEPATPHTITQIFDSVFGGRGAGLIGFSERDGRASIAIESFDQAAATLAMDFVLPVRGWTSSYPPDFDSAEECSQTEMVMGRFAGPFEIYGGIADGAKQEATCGASWTTNPATPGTCDLACEEMQTGGGPSCSTTVKLGGGADPYVCASTFEFLGEVGCCLDTGQASKLSGAHEPARERRVFFATCAP